MPIQVIKASGEIENFDETKLAANLKWAKIPEDIASDALTYVKNKLEDRISTQKIHDYVREYLYQNRLVGHLLNYDLKRALMRFGPSGYPFEKFVARILSAFGYLSRNGLIIQGQCVSHEIDIDAQKNSEHYLVECKFHNQPGTKTDIQAALYTYARFLDIRTALEHLANHHQQYHQAWLVTNTKITKDVIAYARCMDMKVIAWGYPAVGNLRELIIGSGLHPVSVLDGLTDHQLVGLYEHDIITCSDLKQAIDSHELPITFPKEMQQHLLDQIGSVCQTAAPPLTDL